MDGEVEYGGPLICPVCAAVRAADDWPTNARFGYRVCPACLADGLGSVIPIEHSPESERRILAALAEYRRDEECSNG